MEVNISVTAGERLLVSPEGNSILYAGLLYRVATVAFERCKLSGSKEDALSIIIFAASAIEAYLNELGEVSDTFGRASGDEILKTLSVVLKDAEDSRLPTTTKCMLAKKFMTGINYDRGANPYQNFALLIDLRNLLIHSKPRGNGIADPSSQDQRILRNLVTRRLCDDPANENFLANIATLKVAHFCCNAAAMMIQDLDASYTMPQVHGVALFSFISDPPEEGLSQTEAMFPIVDLPI